MIDGKRVLGVIPARGGSKGIPGKNIFMIGGKPLIAWTIDAALESKYIDRLILSSDDDEIINVAKTLGCEVPFKRDMQLAADDTPGVDVVIDALNRCSGYDYVVLLQPTSPLRTTEDIDTSLEYCIQNNAPACVSVCKSQHSPYWMFTLDKSKHMTPLLSENIPACRQSLPSVYVLNGAVYIARVEWLIDKKTFIASQTIAYEMLEERSIDIDTEFDMKMLEIKMGH